MICNRMSLHDIACKLADMQIARKSGRIPNPDDFAALLAAGKAAIARARDTPLCTVVISMTPELVAALPEADPTHRLLSCELEDIRPWVDSDLLILAQSRGLRLSPLIRNLLSPPCLHEAVRAAAAETSLLSEICDSSTSLVRAPAVEAVADLLRIQATRFAPDMGRAATTFLYRQDFADFMALMLAGVKPDNPELDPVIYGFPGPIEEMLTALRSAHGQMKLQQFGPLEAFLADWPYRVRPFREEFGL